MIFNREKADGSKRFILNLNELNLFIDTVHFKLEDLRSACRLLEQGVYMGSIDINEAYFTIPVHKSSRKYLGFIFQDQIFEFTCLPFGLCLSPYIFTKLMKPVMGKLRQEGLVSVIYLDDILCLAPSKKDCHDNLQETINLLEQLGFIVNKKKFNPLPDTRCRYLGFIVDSARMIVELLPEKKHALSTQVKSLKNKNTCKIRTFAQIIGMLVASCPAVDYGLLHWKLFEKANVEALNDNEENYDRNMNIPSYIIDDLNWWQKKLPVALRKIRNFKFKKEIFSDACLTG